MLPATQRGLKVLGIPIGEEAFVQRFLENKSTEQQVLFQRIPWVNDPQSAYLLLLMLRFHQGQFLVARSEAGRHGVFCQAPR